MAWIRLCLSVFYSAWTVLFIFSRLWHCDVFCTLFLFEMFCRNKVHHIFISDKIKTRYRSRQRSKINRKSNASRSPLSCFNVMTNCWCTFNFFKWICFVHHTQPFVVCVVEFITCIVLMSDVRFSFACVFCVDASKRTGLGLKMARSNRFSAITARIVITLTFN